MRNGTVVRFYLKSYVLNWVWWCILVIPAPERAKQENYMWSAGATQ